MSDQQRLDYWKRRARDAERRVTFEEEHTESTRQWALEAFAEQRRLSGRCTYLYGLAARHGASDDDLHASFTTIESRPS